MKKTLFRWQAASFIFVSIAGTLLHFAYDWSGQSVLLAPFSGVNESTWEHMKLFFWPMFVFSVIRLTEPTASDTLWLKILSKSFSIKIY